MARTRSEKWIPPTELFPELPSPDRFPSSLNKVPSCLSALASSLQNSWICAKLHETAKLSLVHHPHRAFRSTPGPEEPSCVLPSGTSGGCSKLCAAQSWGQHSSALGQQRRHWNTQPHAGSFRLQEQGIFWKSIRYGGCGGDTSFSWRETTQVYCCQTTKMHVSYPVLKNLWKTRWTALK